MTAEAIAAPRRLEANVDLAPKTTLGVGGKARFFATFNGEAELRNALLWALANELPWWILGEGSNVVIADEGLPGLVLQPNSAHLVFDQHGQVTVDAGVAWDFLVEVCVARGLAGIECLSGIPGMCGAAPIQNIGAYGQQLSDVFAKARVFDTETCTVNTWSRQQCGFGYRDSVFKQTAPGSHVILDITLGLQTGGKPTIRYPGLRARLGADASLQEVRQVVLDVRSTKGMVVSSADPDSRSAGSFFVNPVVSEDAATAVAARLGRVDMPRWDVDGGIKLSAAWLIAASGMDKGYGDGPVGLSTKHTLALVNRGQGTAADIADFAQHVADCVFRSTGIQLHAEPRFLGMTGLVTAP